MASYVAATASTFNPSLGAVASLRPESPLRTPELLALPLPGLMAVKLHSSACRKRSVNKVVVSSSQHKQLDLAWPTAACIAAATVIPEIAEAAQPGISPSLKNLLLSVLAGGVVAVVIGVAVAGVSVFDPVKRK